MFVHANIATVPAFAPVHEYADWYWAFLETKPDMVLHPTCPLPEVVAWHREHAGGRPFDDFIPELTFERFDADEYAQLLDDAGMRYLVHVTKHHDGFCWWDTALLDAVVDATRARSVTSPPSSPTRCARRGHVFGCYYSLLDWGHAEYPDPERYVDAYMRPQIQELVERFEPALLWGDGHWGHPGRALARRPDPRRRPRGRRRARLRARVQRPLVRVASHDYAVYEYDVPDVAARGSLGAVPRARLLVLREPQRARRRPPDRRAGRRAARRDRGQGRQPAAQRRPERRRHRARHPGARCCATRARGCARTRTRSTDRPASTCPATGSTGTRGSAPTCTRSTSSSARRSRRFAGLGRCAACARARRNRARVPGGGGRARDRRRVRSTRDPFGTRYVVELGDARSRRGREPAAGRRRPWRAALRDDHRGARGRGGRRRRSMSGRAATRARSARRSRSSCPAGVTLRAGGVAGDAPGRDRRAAARSACSSRATTRRSSAITVTGAAPGYMMIPPTCVISSGGDRIVVRDCHVESIALTGGTGHRVIGNVIAGGAVSLMGTTRMRGARQLPARAALGRRHHDRGRRRPRRERERVPRRPLRDPARRTPTARASTTTGPRRAGGASTCSTPATPSCGRTRRGTRCARSTWRARSARGNVIERQLAEHCDTGVVIERGATRTRGRRFVVPRLPGRPAGVGSRVGRGHEHRDQRAPRPRRRLRPRARSRRAIELDGDVWIA